MRSARAAQPDLPLIVEVETLVQLEEALALDNVVLDTPSVIRVEE